MILSLREGRCHMEMATNDRAKLCAWHSATGLIGVYSTSQYCQGFPDSALNTVVSKTKNPGLEVDLSPEGVISALWSPRLSFSPCRDSVILQPSGCSGELTSQLARRHLPASFLCPFSHACQPMLPTPSFQSSPRLLICDTCCFGQLR